jgi:hypothetical protein
MRHALAIFAASLALSCGGSGPRAPAVAPEHVVFALGEGGEPNGREIVLVTDLGECEYDFQVSRYEKGATSVAQKRAHVRVTEATFRDLFALLDEVKFFSMPDHLSDPSVVGGSEWFIDVQRDGVWKRVSLVNLFPLWAHRIDAFVRDRLLGTARGPKGEPGPETDDLSANEAQKIERRWDPAAAAP